MNTLLSLPSSDGQKVATDGPIRVVVCEDHPMMRRALQTHLAGSDPQVQVVAAVASAAELAAVDADRVDLALVDVALDADTDGLEAARALLDASPQLPVVFYSAVEDPEVVRAAIEMGARGYLSKTGDPDELVASLRQAVAGEQVFDSVSALLAVEALKLEDDRPRLSSREREVLQLMSDGLTNATIGRRLEVSTSTVKTLAARARRKLGAGDRTAAVAEALRHGLIE